MTCRELFYKKHAEMDHGARERLFYESCPADFQYLSYPDYCREGVDRSACKICWDREIYNYEERISMNDENSIIKDSGERTTFTSGAQRDMHEGKGDMASVPWEAILRLSVHYENGAKKYERWNFRKGIPVSSFIDSACRHLAKYQCGCDDEDHLAAAAFNVLGAMLMENTKPEMVDLPLRQGKNTFDYFKENS